MIQNIRKQYAAELAINGDPDRARLILHDTFKPILDPSRHRLHPEDHKAKETINSILHEAQLDLNIITQKYNQIASMYLDILNGSKEEAQLLGAEYIKLINKIKYYHDYCSNTFVSIKSFVLNDQDLITLPVSAISFVTEENRIYNIIVNGKEYKILPYNSDKEGVKTIGSYGCFPESSDVLFVEEPVKSAIIKAPAGTEIVALYGKVAL